MYRRWPLEMRAVDEVEFVAGVAAMSASGGCGPIKWPKASSATPTSRLCPQTGQIVLRGPAAELRENELIRQAYLGELKVCLTRPR